MKWTSLFLLLFILQISQAQIITTVAGNATYGYSGNGGPAVAAQLGWQGSVVTDNVGNIYIADHDNNVIRKVNTIGIITNYAGTGVLGYSGDGALATSARLYHPGWLGIDKQNNLYFADQNANVIRKINFATGIITTITGNLPSGYSGDGGPLILARFTGISGIAFDNAGNMFISDQGNHVIRKVNLAGIISTVVGSGTSGFSGDGGPAVSAKIFNSYKVVFDVAGNMYIPDNGNKRIRKVSPSGIITTYAGNGTYGWGGDGGPATAASLGFPWTIDLDQNGNLFIGDAGTYVVRKVDPNGIITTYAGTGTYGNTGDGGIATLAQLGEIASVHIDLANDLLISVRSYFNVVRKVNNCLASTISQQPASVTLCNSGNAVFNITALNGLTFQWQQNSGSGWNDLSDNTVYSGTGSNNLQITGADVSMNGFLFRCKTINTCGSTFSLPAALEVFIPSLPALLITTSTPNVCIGTNVQFTASATNGGTTPLYQWKKNGINVGNNLDTYADAGLMNGDVIACLLTSNSNCLSIKTVESNNIIMSVNALVTPVVTISSSANNVCQNTPVTFTATAVNAGMNPGYQWKKNGINTGTNLPAYTDITINNGDVVTCQVIASSGCFVTPEANSNSIVMLVYPLLSPSVTINSSDLNVCAGKSVAFFATPTNAGPSPVYQWQLNGINVGSNSNSFTSATLANGDNVTCKILSTGSCLVTDTATGNSVKITVFQNPVVVLDKKPTLCIGSSRILDAGPYSSYLWNDGSTSRTIQASTLGLYYVSVTDNNQCNGTDTTKISVHLPLPNDFLPKDTSVCSYGELTIRPKQLYQKYLWNNNTSQSFISVKLPGTYWLEVQDNNFCTGRDTILVAPKECITGFYIPSAFTPNNDGKNDLFKPLLFGVIKKYSFSIYNRWGQLVFKTTEPNRGWDGSLIGIQQDANTFVWICNYQLLNQKEEIKKGTVVLFR